MTIPLFYGTGKQTHHIGPLPQQARLGPLGMDLLLTDGPHAYTLNL